MIGARLIGIALLLAVGVSGCGGDVSVAVCFGTAQFCSQGLRPVAKAGPSQTVAPGSLVTLDGSDSEGNIASYSWAQTGGPIVALSNANGAVATFIAPNATSAVTLSFRLTVVNETSQADTDSTSVIVQPQAAVALSWALELLDHLLQPTSMASKNPLCTAVA